MTKFVERTAIATFKLDGQDVPPGQVVTLTSAQLKHLAAAGCVALTDEDNEDVPKRDLPLTQGTIASTVDALTTQISADDKTAEALAAKQRAEDEAREALAEQARADAKVQADAQAKADAEAALRAAASSRPA